MTSAKNNNKKYNIRSEGNSIIIFDKNEKEKYVLEDIKKLILTLLSNLTGIQSADDLVAALNCTLRYSLLNSSYYSHSLLFLLLFFNINFIIYY